MKPMYPSLSQCSFEMNISELKYIMSHVEPKYDELHPPMGGLSGHEINNIYEFGKVAFEKFGKLENRFSRTPYANFELGDELYVDNRIDNLFITSKRGPRRVGIIVACYNPKVGNTAKALLFDYLDFTQPEFDTSSVATGYYNLPLKKRTGNIIRAYTKDYHNVYDMVHNCRTEQGIWEIIKGKCLKVVDIIETPGGLYIPNSDSHPSIVGFYPRTEKRGIISIRKVPVFEFVDKNPVFLSDYDPRYFYGDYRIVREESSGKWGITNVKTNNTVVECVFDDIKWGASFWNQGNSYSIYSNDGIDESTTRHFEYVRFYRNGKKALFRISDLEKIDCKGLKESEHIWRSPKL